MIVRLEPACPGTPCSHGLLDMASFVSTGAISIVGRPKTAMKSIPGNVPWLAQSSHFLFFSMTILPEQC